MLSDTYDEQQHRSVEGGGAKWYPEGLEILGAVEIKDEAPDAIGEEPQVVMGREGLEGLKNEDTSGGSVCEAPTAEGDGVDPFDPRENLLLEVDEEGNVVNTSSTS